ncbi:DUF3883 domain-containing protein, partial [Candidatus Nanopelagicales bacterium]|nr:DUF3883 domain-containing protein [Candidatus Nanopelagicales bacterium]
GIAESTWGFRDNAQPTGPQVLDLILFGWNFSGKGGPRIPEPEWQKGAANIAVGQVTMPMYRANAPLWQDEIDAGHVIYPWRLGFVLLGSLEAVPLGRGGPLANEAGTLRQAGITNRGQVAPLNSTIVDSLAVLLGRDISVSSSAQSVDTHADALKVDLSDSPGLVTPPILGPDRHTSGGGAGISTDKYRNKAVEDRAVKLAIGHYEASGWTVKELGKPFDLVCMKDDGSEKHVEVKGTSTAGATVTYTSNEVKHFRNCPLPGGADLVVVRDIVVQGQGETVTASSGDLRCFPGYKAPSEDLQAVTWQGRVPW